MKKLSGKGEVVRNLRIAQAGNQKRILSGVTTESQIELTEMKRRTPVDTRPNAPHPGNLRNSLSVDVVQDGKRTTATFSTGAQAPYAVYVHENPDAFHPVGEWKFIESVLNESRPYWRVRLAEHVKLGKKA